MSLSTLIYVGGLVLAYVIGDYVRLKINRRKIEELSAKLVEVEQTNQELSETLDRAVSDFFDELEVNAELNLQNAQLLQQHERILARFN